MSETAKKVKWTDEQETVAREGYDPSDPASVDRIAAKLDRSRRSVIGKLVSLGVYQAPAKPEPKPKDEGPTKADILKALGAAIDTEGADGATKPFLARVADRLGVKVEAA